MRTDTHRRHERVGERESVAERTRRRIGRRASTSKSVLRPRTQHFNAASGGGENFRCFTQQASTLGDDSPELESHYLLASRSETVVAARDVV